MKTMVTYYVIARAPAPVAISCRQLVACGIPDAPVQTARSARHPLRAYAGTHVTGS